MKLALFPTSRFVTFTTILLATKGKPIISSFQQGDEYIIINEGHYVQKPHTRAIMHM